MGLGPTRDVGLGKARDLAAKLHELRRAGTDPLEAHRAGQRARATPATRAMSLPPMRSGLHQCAQHGLGKPGARQAIKVETASRVRGRIESILGWATAAGYRQGDNPARRRCGATRRSGSNFSMWHPATSLAGD